MQDYALQDVQRRRSKILYRTAVTHFQILTGSTDSEVDDTIVLLSINRRKSEAAAVPELLFACLLLLF